MITSKEYLDMWRMTVDKRLSLETFIDRIRYNVAHKHSYILSAVNYDQILLDLVDLNELDRTALLGIKWED